mmetsp:Transcript_56269/g.163122  ORF Transcript_56269/g.163122 Transcript_56269/m.163122 type:complete len:235 (+) Transcript_56269:196-900(+)
MTSVESTSTQDSGVPVEMCRSMKTCGVQFASKPLARPEPGAFGEQNAENDVLASGSIGAAASRRPAPERRESEGTGVCSEGMSAASTDKAAARLSASRGASSALVGRATSAASAPSPAAASPVTKPSPAASEPAPSASGSPLPALAAAGGGGSETSTSASCSTQRSRRKSGTSVSKEEKRPPELLTEGIREPPKVVSQVVLTGEMSSVSHSFLAAGTFSSNLLASSSRARSVGD